MVRGSKYIEIQIGPRIEPCGTPQVMGAEEEDRFPISQGNVLSLTKVVTISGKCPEWQPLFVFSRMSWFATMVKESEGGTVSYRRSFNTFSRADSARTMMSYEALNFSRI